MNIPTFPVGYLIIVVIIVTLLFIELGYRIGKKIYLKTALEKDSVVSSVAGYVLALLAFIMAFTFGIVSSRYDTKKALVREEANAIRTVWFRSDFLPDSERVASKKLLIEYVDTRISGIESKDEASIKQSLARCEEIQQLLWKMAVVNGYRNLNSDVGALYIESLNDMINIHITRVIVSFYSRVPTGIWFILMVMVIIGMMLVGYMTATAGSNRSWAFVFLAISFSLVIGMVYTMDKLYSPFTPISQFAMEQLLNFMKVHL